MTTKTWRDHVSPRFKLNAEASLRKSRANVLRVKRFCANRWVDLRCIDSGVDLRGRVS